MGGEISATSPKASGEGKFSMLNPTTTTSSSSALRGPSLKEAKVRGSVRNQRYRLSSRRFPRASRRLQRSRLPGFSVSSRVSRGSRLLSSSSRARASW